MAEAAGSSDSSELERLQARVRELEHDRKHLLGVIEILQEISGTLHFVDILQAITRKLGETFGLDRCSIFLAERGARTARLVASYEDPSIRNYLVDLERYPELQRALASGETVFIPDAQAEPKLRHVKGLLEHRRVKSITVVPITWQGVAIGAIYLRSFQEGTPFSDGDIRFTQVVANLAAKALRSAYRYERLVNEQSDTSPERRSEDLRRIALISFLRRLFDAYMEDEGIAVSGQLPKSAAEELDRLVEIALTVFDEEAKGV